MRGGKRCCLSAASSCSGTVHIPYPRHSEGKTSWKSTIRQPAAPARTWIGGRGPRERVQTESQVTAPELDRATLQRKAAAKHEMLAATARTEEEEQAHWTEGSSPEALFEMKARLSASSTSARASGASAISFTCPVQTSLDERRDSKHVTVLNTRDVSARAQPREPSTPEICPARRRYYSRLRGIAQDPPQRDFAPPSLQHPMPPPPHQERPFPKHHLHQHHPHHCPRSPVRATGVFLSECLRAIEKHAPSS